MMRNVNKARVTVPGEVMYEKAIVQFRAEDDGTMASVVIMDRRENLVRQITAPRWVQAGKGWTLLDLNGDTIATLEPMTGCGCGGMVTTDLSNAA